MPRRRHNNNRVIQRTTSETIRIGGETDANHRPSNLPPPHTKKTVSSASFVVTGVSTRADAATCDSPDDSEEFSRQTDIETPSFSEDTSYSQYTEDVDYCACEEIILKRCVNAVMTASDEAPQEPTSSNAASSPIKIITSSSSSTSHIPSPGRFIGRFQVVKVESIHPFRRGRWICHDYVDNSEYAPKDGYEYFRGKFIKRKELEIIKKQMEQETFIFDPLMDINAQQGMHNITQPVALLHKNTAAQTFNSQKIISTTPRPILRTGCAPKRCSVFAQLTARYSNSNAVRLVVYTQIPFVRA
ncbi:PREDICTED: uncharacterized protein LOC108557330 isoform X2 [Nicrophorus vespilloides]|uniref:Uncharacterized protein LOC108557330 isoform X2 n=1 Tax=Nicrophorus vespilloides TaxID=110193 RepID=A0ABM1M3Z7_NICVS|nr:PREDICTED: uncharacterized protein LOC108557330 isoform X2 [Nicrophorus vespilloides]